MSSFIMLHFVRCKYLSDDASGPKITPGYFKEWGGKGTWCTVPFVSGQSHSLPSVWSVTFWVSCMSSLDKRGQTQEGSDRLIFKAETCVVNKLIVLSLAEVREEFQSATTFTDE